MRHFQDHDYTNGYPVLGARRYHRVDEVARYFGVSDRTIYRLIDMGDLKAIRLRDCLRIPVAEIPEFEARRRDDPPKSPKQKGSADTRSANP